MSVSPPRSSERGPVEAARLFPHSPGRLESSPRSSERGPVEAARPASHPSRLPISPRSSERGPGEAPRRPVPRPECRYHLRAPRSAAPLKPLACSHIPRAASSHLRAPRSAAPLKPLVLLRIHLGCPYLRAPRSAAPLKLRDGQCPVRNVDIISALLGARPR